jgi:hypothetical protein
MQQLFQSTRSTHMIDVARSDEEERVAAIVANLTSAEADPLEELGGGSEGPADATLFGEQWGAGVSFDQSGDGIGMSLSPRQIQAAHELLVRMRVCAC